MSIAHNQDRSLCILWSLTLFLWDIRIHIEIHKGSLQSKQCTKSERRCMQNMVQYNSCRTHLLRLNLHYKMIHTGYFEDMVRMYHSQYMQYQSQSRLNNQNCKLHKYYHWHRCHSGILISNYCCRNMDRYHCQSMSSKQYHQSKSNTN